MDMLGWDDRIAVSQGTRGARIFRNHDLETQVGGGACGGVYAHVGHHTGDDDTLDVPLLQQIQ